MMVSVKLVAETKGAVNRGIIYQDSLGGLPPTSLSDAHVTDALLSLGNLQVAWRPIRTRKTVTESPPRASTKRGALACERNMENEEVENTSPVEKGVAKVSGSVGGFQKEMEDNCRGESLCKVCGDKASGKHYGVPSCDGCRGFFKRSIRRYARNLDYVCKENGRCIVDVSRRNQCQACRFTKCLQVNMKRDGTLRFNAVQHERAPRNTSSLVAAARRCPSGLYPGISHVYHAASNPYHSLLYPALFPFKPTMPAFTPSVAHFLPRSSAEPLTMNTAKEDEVTSSEEAGTIDARIESKEDLTSSRLAPPIVNSGSTEYVSNFSILPTENIYEFAAKLLFFAVRWARSIHSFLQLPYRDQTILLEESWSELFVLTAAQWNFPVEEATLVPSDFSSERKEMLVDEVRRLRELLAKCVLLRVDHSEYACLKAIVLFKGESRGLCEPGRVTALQEQTVAVFCERDARRVGRLLLLLPPARALCRATLQELLFKPTVGDVSVERLLGDMVSALRPT